MKKIIISSMTVALLAGCSTPKAKYLAGAESTRALSSAIMSSHKCKVIANSAINDTHPNNLNVEVINEAYILGGTHYRITGVTTKDYKGRNSGVAFDVYRCIAPDVATKFSL